jgi:lipopolysaccharide biosynthesis protein
MANSILGRLARCKSRPDLLISVRDQNSKNAVEKVSLQYGLKVKRIAIVPNRGRDIGPLLTEFGKEVTEKYEIIGHIHTKKSVAIEGKRFVEDWAEFLYGNLLGNKKPMMDIILRKMNEDRLIGLVYPDDPFVMGWGENEKYVLPLLKKMRMSDKNLFENINFPAGNMFWARTKALQPLFDLKLHWSDYPKEPLPYDGSMLHAIERLSPMICEKQKFKTIVTNDPDLRR